MKSEQLKALYLSPDDQVSFVTCLPEVRFVAELLGESTFSEEKNSEYTIEEIGQFLGNLSQKLLKGLNWELRLGLWFIFAIISAALNSNAIYAIAPDAWGDAAKLSIAFTVSFGLVLCADSAIAIEIKASLQRRDAALEKTALSKTRDDNQKEELKAALVHGEETAFKRVQGKHLQKSLVRSRLIYAGLSFYLFLELGASIHRTIDTGGDLEWVAVTAPLLGGLLNVLVGSFKGIAISYPGNRRTIASHYRARYSKINENDQLKQDIELMNHLVAIFIRNPGISPVDMRREKDLIESMERFDRIRTLYQAELKRHSDAHKQTLKSLMEEMHQSTSSQYEVRSAIDAFEREYADETVGIVERCQNELTKLRQDMEVLNLPTGDIDAFGKELEQKKSFHSSEKDRFYQQEITQRLRGRFKQIRSEYESELVRLKSANKQTMKDFREEMRQDSVPRPSMQLDINRCQQEYINEQIKLGRSYQVDLQELQKEYQEANLKTDMIEDFVEELDRRTLSLRAEEDCLRQEETNLEFDECLEKIRTSCGSDLKLLKQNLEEQEQQSEEQKKEQRGSQQSISHNGEAVFYSQISKHRQEYERKVLEAINYYQFELTKLREEMEKATYSTRTLEAFWKSLEEKKQEHFRKLEQFH